MFASLKHKFKIWPRSKHTQSRITKTCTGIKKNKQTNRCTKPAQAPRKKQTTRCTKPAQAPKKTKKLKFPGTMGPLLSSCWIFFCFFGACRCLVHLVVCFFCFFWCLSMFCEVRVTKPAQAPKKPNH